MLITFSGLDGAGKTTLIQFIKGELESKGKRVQVLTMYDHIGLYPAIRFLRDCTFSLLRLNRGGEREKTGSSHVGGEKTESSHRFHAAIVALFRNRWVKRCIYPLDIMLLFFYRLYFQRIKQCILITDRYFYDSLADVVDGRDRGVIKLFLSLTPEPDVPVFVDVDPKKAFDRKGEYNVPYLTLRREVYKKIFSRLGDPIVLDNDDLGKAKKSLVEIVMYRSAEKK